MIYLPLILVFYLKRWQLISHFVLGEGLEDEEDDDYEDDDEGDEEDDVEDEDEEEEEGNEIAPAGGRPQGADPVECKQQ